MILSLRGKLLASQRSHPQILRQGEAVNYVHVNSVALATGGERKNRGSRW